MPEPIHVVYEDEAGRVLVTNSATAFDERVTTTDVVVAGSFSGEQAVAMALRRGARAFLGSTAGIGLDGAGVSGLALGERLGVPVAASSEYSALLGDGMDNYTNGVIARVNEVARALGVREEMPCAEAATLLLKAHPGTVGRVDVEVDKRRVIAYDGPEGQVVTMISATLATADNTGQVICAGSHAAALAGLRISEFSFPIAGFISNDAGVGKDRAGIAGLDILDAAGVPAATVGAMSARIGSGASTYADGVISHSNAVASALGVRAGQSARVACLAMLSAQ